jgi:hypothetical protein
MVTLVSKLSTEFHRDLASHAWLRNLAAHVERALIAHDDYETSDGEGVVSSEYNEKRFMGPLSIVKYYFVVTVHLRRSDSTGRDTYEAHVEYCPETNTFQTFYETVDTEANRQAAKEAEQRRAAALQVNAHRLRERTGYPFFGVEQVGRTCVVKALRYVFDFEENDRELEVKEVLDFLHTTTAENVVIEFCGIGQMTGTLAHFAFAVAVKVLKGGGRVAFCSMSENVREAATLLRLNAVGAICDSLADALAEVEK